MARIERELGEIVGNLQVHVTTARGEATAAARRAAEQGVERVVAAAGDGTVREVIDGLAGSQVPLAIIPLGTGNVLARELKLPLDSWRPRGLQRSLDVIRAGHVRAVDLGSGNGNLFVLMAGVGFDAAVVRGVRPHWKDRLGSWAYLLAIAETLASARPARFRVHGDGGGFEGKAWAVVVGNAASYAWKLHLGPNAKMDDGLLNVVVFRDAPRARFASLIVEAVWAGHQTSRYVTQFAASQVHIEADPPAPVQMDGDALATTPLSVTLRRGALRLIVPPPQWG
jgi:diacylglycerol kinase (ATP)